MKEWRIVTYDPAVRRAFAVRRLGIAFQNLAEARTKAEKAKRVWWASLWGSATGFGPPDH